MTFARFSLFKTQGYCNAKNEVFLNNHVRSIFFILFVFQNAKHKQQTDNERLKEIPLLKQSKCQD